MSTTNDTHSNDNALSRRAFLSRTGTAVAGLAAAAVAAPPGQARQNSTAPVTIGTGYWTYTLDPNWGKLPPGMKFGWGVGMVADSRDRIYVHSRSPQAVAVFDRAGNLLSTWGAEFAGTAHGLYHSREGSDDEFLYFTDHPRNLVVKTTLDGKTVMRLGKGAGGAKNGIEFDRFNQPTDLAVAPNGDFYVCEGYGGNVLQHFTRDGKHLRTIGAPGNGPGQFKTPHGIWVDRRKKNQEPEIYVADRGNRRIQVLTLDGTYKRTFAEDVRAPCCFYTRGPLLFIPDLESRVTILDRDDRLVTHLGDGRSVNPTDGKATVAQTENTFQAPHALCLDSRGDLYVVEWLPYGRPRRFRHTPA